MFRVSQYKFFGPHAGALYGRYDLLDQLRAYKVRPADDIPPHKFETGAKGLEDKTCGLWADLPMLNARQCGSHF